MKLTKKQAVDQSIQIWERMAKTGETKREAIVAIWNGNKQFLGNCPLCEYDYKIRMNKQGGPKCEECPWDRQHVGRWRCIHNSNSSYVAYHTAEWQDDLSPKTIKKVAPGMVKYLKTLKEKP